MASGFSEELHEIRDVIWNARRALLSRQRNLQVIKTALQVVD